MGPSDGRRDIKALALTQAQGKSESRGIGQRAASCLNLFGRRISDGFQENFSNVGPPNRMFGCTNRVRSIRTIPFAYPNAPRGATALLAAPFGGPSPRSHIRTGPPNEPRTSQPASERRSDLRTHLLRGSSQLRTAPSDLRTWDTSLVTRRCTQPLVAALRPRTSLPAPRVA